MHDSLRFVQVYSLLDESVERRTSSQDRIAERMPSQRIDTEASRKAIATSQQDLETLRNRKGENGR